MPLLNGLEKANSCLDYQLIRDKSYFHGSYNWFVLVDKKHYVLVAMKFRCASHLVEIATPVSQLLSQLS